MASTNIKYKRCAVLCLDLEDDISSSFRSTSSKQKHQPRVAKRE